MDEHTDYVLNWIEEATYLVAECLHAEIEEEKIIEKLKELYNVEDDMLSLILISGQFLYHDEINNYIGE